ncbi:MAG: site-specific integrase [Chloroflexota bacterium]|nr:site-specific integrase [Chloroflexota bacterium]
MIDEEPSDFVDRVVGGIDLDDESLHPAEGFAGLARLVVGRVSVDGWPGWIESDGHRSRELVEGLRAMGAVDFAEVVEEVLALYPAADSADVDTRLSGPLELSAYRTRLDLLFAPALAQNGPTERIRPLADGEDERLRELVSPLRAADGRRLLPFRFRSDNPFEPETRLRNWLMYQLARELGFRRSEILALWISDIESGPPAVVNVRRRPNNAADTRRDPASVKRGERALPPSDLLRAGFRAYQTTRWPVGRLGVNTPILLTSSVSRAPLAIRSASHVIETLGRTAGIEDLCWHSLRHTWAEEVATDLLTDHGGDEERSLAVLCQLGGWSNTSPTPKHYIQNALRREAWRFQEHRAKRLWGSTRAIEAGA